MTEKSAYRLDVIRCKTLNKQSKPYSMCTTLNIIFFGNHLNIARNYLPFDLYFPELLVHQCLLDLPGEGNK